MGKSKAGLLSLSVLLAGSSWGCLASQVAGDIARSNQKQMDLTLAPGVDGARLRSYQGMGVQLRPVSGAGQYTASMGGGTTNTAVYSDMLVQKLLALGISARSLEEEMPAAQFPQLRSTGIDLVLVGNLNLSMTSSASAYVTGGDYLNTGVSGFSLRGVDAGSGDVVFILSAEYGKSRSAGDVAEDIVEVLQNAMTGTAPTVEREVADVESSTAIASEGESATARPLNEHGADLVWVQMKLNDRGYECGTADGIMGPNTRACVRAFQKAEGLPVTGRLDLATSRELRALP